MISCFVVSEFTVFFLIFKTSPLPNPTESFQPTHWLVAQPCVFCSMHAANRHQTCVGTLANWTHSESSNSLICTGTFKYLCFSLKQFSSSALRSFPSIDHVIRARSRQFHYGYGRYSTAVAVPAAPTVPHVCPSP